MKNNFIHKQSAGCSFETDEHLAVLAASGSQEAFSELLERYTGLIFHKISCSRSCGLETEDLFQEASIALLYAARSFCEGKAAFRTYAGICIDNRIKTAIRQNSGTTAHCVGLSGCDEWLKDFEQADLCAGPEEQVLIDEGVSELTAKLESILTDFEYNVFTSYISGLRYEQIAQVMGTDKKSVDNALQRARAKLRRVLA